MARDNAPVPHTCPTIDHIIAEIEKVREANDALRSWGNDLYEQLEKLESKSEEEYSDLQDNYDELKRTKEELESRVEELERIIAELEKQLEER